MAAIWMRLRSEMRARWRVWLALAVVLGIAAGAATAAAAGARRTGSAYARFVEAQHGFHALTGGGDEDDYPQRFEAIRNLPEVADSVVVVIAGAQVTFPATRGLPERELGLFEAFVVADPDGRMLHDINRAKVLSGRLPDPARADEVAVPFTLAERWDVAVGDRVLGGIGFDFETFGPLEHVPLTVTGIVAAPGDFDAVGQPQFPLLYATAALLERHEAILPPMNPETWNLGVRLRDGPQAAQAFKQRIERDFRLDVPLIEPVVRSGVEKTMRLYAAALWILAALIGLASVAIFGQAMARQAMLDASDHPVLRALGMGRGQLVGLGLARAAAVALPAAAVAVTVAILVSPLTPIGAARVAEPAPGFAFDALALGLGAVVTVLVVLGVSVWPTIRAARVAGLVGPGEARTGRPSAVVATAARATSSPAVVAGVRMALEPGRGRTAVPVRSTILAVAVGIAALTGVVVVARSLTHLIDTPALAGLTYDAIVPGGDDQDHVARRQRLESHAFVEHASIGTGMNVIIDGVDAFIVAFEHGRAIGFAVIQGRPPSTDVADLPEIALGPATMRRVGLSIGDVIEFAYSRDRDAPDGSQRARVVGTAAIPPLPWAAVEPGEGGVMTVEAIATFNPEAQGGCCFVRFREGTDLGRARDELQRDGFEVQLRVQRADLGTLERITQLPVLLGALFAVLALATMTHVLVTGIRRRRRDLAILKTLGFVRRQVAGAVAWQSSVIAAVAIAVGIPAGIALGRWGWSLVADQFGVVPVSMVPALALVLLLPAAVLLANVIAAFPARAAARTEPAVVLRSE